MKSLVLALTVLGPTMVLAQTSFDGVWRLNLQNTQYLGKETYDLQKDVFQCTSCDPQINTKADGADHPLTGLSIQGRSRYYNRLSSENRCQHHRRNI